MTTPPRLVPLEPPFEPAVGESLLRRMPKTPAVPPLALFRLLAGHQALSAAMEPLGAFHLRRGAASLAPRDREVVILRVCARAGCEYEWGVHVVGFAARVGLTPEQVTETARGAGSALTERDALLVSLVDELHDTGTASDALWERLAAAFTAEQLLELLVLAGWYHAVSFVANAARLPLEPWAERFPASIVQG